MIRDNSFLAVNGSVFLLMFGVGMIVARLPMRLIQLSGSVSHVGYLASVFAVSYVLFQVPVGTLSDRLGFRGFLVSGYYLCALTGLLYYFSESQGTILLGRFLQGAGEVPVWQASAMLSIAYPSAKGRVMGLYNAAIHLGLTLGAGAGVLLSSMTGGYLLYAGVSFLGGSIIWAFAEEPAGDRVECSFGGRGIRPEGVISSRAFWVWAGILLYGGGYGVFLTIVPGVLITVNGFTQEEVGVFFTLFYVMVSVSQVVAGSLSDRWGSRLPMVFGLGLAAAGLPFFLNSGKAPALFFLGMSSLGLGGFHVSSMVFLNKNTPDALKGAVSGAYYLFWGAGYFILPVLMGQTGENTGFSAAFRGLALLFCVEAVLLWISGVKKRRVVKTG